MSNIKFYVPQTSVVAFSYSSKETLQFYITKVLNRIGETDTGITWYICSEIDLQNIQNPNRPEYIKRIERITGVTVEPLYALTDRSKKEIYVSTKTIASAPPVAFGHFTKVFTPINDFKEREKLLVLVIIDELTHILANAGHGNARYEEQYEKYVERYFSRNRLLF